MFCKCVIGWLGGNVGLQAREPYDTLAQATRLFMKLTVMRGWCRSHQLCSLRAKQPAATGRAEQTSLPLQQQASGPHLICGSLQFCRSMVSSRRSARCAQRTVGERMVAIAGDQAANEGGVGAARSSG